MYSSYYDMVPVSFMPWLGPAEAMEKYLMTSITDNSTDDMMKGIVMILTIMLKVC